MKISNYKSIKTVVETGITYFFAEVDITQFFKPTKRVKIYISSNQTRWMNLDSGEEFSPANSDRIYKLHQNEVAKEILKKTIS